MEIRAITVDDIPRYAHIMSHSFARGVPREITPENLASHTRIWAYESGRLQAALTLIDYEMFFGAERRLCGGIAGVACEPAARGRGYARALVMRILETMRERGQYLSLLSPFDHRFYQDFGWEWCGQDRWNQVPLRLLPSDAEARHLQPVLENIGETLNPIYEACASRYNGALARGQERWEYHLKFDSRWPAAYIYRRDDRLEGFLIMRYPENNKEVCADQFAAVTARAYRGLLGLARHHSMHAESFKWRGLPDDPIWSIVANWDVEVKLEPGGMGRIVDVCAASSALKPATDIRGSAIIELADDKAPWNAGTWRVTAEAGMVRAERTSDAAGVTLDIRALTQAYWGSPSLFELRKWDRIGVTNETEFDFLARLMPPACVWLADDF